MPSPSTKTKAKKPSNSERFNLGGAGNVALNIANINGQVDLYGSIAKDFEGSKILELLKNTNVNSMISSDNLKTTLKNRLVGQNGQQICRWDNEEKYELNTPLTLYTLSTSLI